MTGDLLKIELRNGTVYSSTGVVDFLQPLLDEFLTDYPDIPLLLRGDSGFATPALYRQCEMNGTSYVIRLKENRVLRNLVSSIEEELMEKTRLDQVSHAWHMASSNTRQTAGNIRDVWSVKWKNQTAS